MSEFEHSYALVVGINNYTKGITPLQTAQPDAKKLAAILENDHHYQVTLITDDTDIKPTRKNLLTLLKNPFPQQQLTEGDRLLFYFAGHGIAFNGDDGPAGFLVPQDGDLQSNDTLIPMGTLYQHLASLKCRHLLVILDSCFAGTFRWSSTRKLIPIPQIITKTHYDRFIKSPAWQAITSASYNQEAFDLIRDNRGTGKDSHHSPFAEALFEALAGGADIIPRDGVITATELYFFLRQSVEPRSGDRQTPGIWTLPKHEHGEYIFLVRGQPKNLAPTPELNQDNNPYRGLEPFDEKHSRFFFGRQELIEELKKHLNKPDHRLTVVLGASGAGKSSLVKAGLIPHLRQEQEQLWHILDPMRPGEYPCEILAKTIQDILPNKIEKLGNALQQNPNALTEIITTWSQEHPQTKLLLIIDQFEELITLTRQTDTATSQENTKVWQPFLNLLTTSLKACPLFHLVVTLRSDFETRFLDSALSFYWTKARFLVRPMRSDEIREAIEKPASEMALYFEPPNLVDRLIDEVGQMPGALPLLSFTLSELYIKLYQKWQNQETSDRALAIDEDFDRQGGVAGSLTSRANQEYTNLEDEQLQTTIRRVMLRMLTVEGWEVARRQVPDSELVYPDDAENKRVWKVLERFVKTRLVIRGQGTEEAYVEPAHDYLVRSWDKLQDWIKEDRDDLSLQQRLTLAANDWVKNGRPKLNYLWPDDDRLNQVEKILNQEKNWFNQRETEFIQASIEHNNLSHGRELAAEAELELQHNRLQSSISLAIKSMQKYRTGQADRTLRQALALLLPIYGYLTHNNEVKAIAFSPDGQILASAVGTSYLPKKNSPCLVKLWSVPNYQAIGNLPHETSIGRICFSSNSQYLATTSGWINRKMQTDQVQVWDIKTRSLISQIKLPDGVNVIAFSPDSQSLIIGSSPHETSLDEMLEQKEQETLEKGLKNSAKSSQYTLAVWNFNSSHTLNLLNHEAKVTLIIISPNGQYLATTGDDKIVKIWEITTYQCRTQLAHENSVESVQFSRDGQYLVTFSGNLVKVWEVATGKPINSLNNQAHITAIAVSTCDDSLATISSNITIWNMLNGQLLISFGDQPKANELIFSPHSQILAEIDIDSWESKVCLWQIQLGQEIGRAICQSKINNVIFSPDNNLLLTANDDKTIRLWNVHNNLEATIFPHQHFVKSISFSSDGSILATAINHHTVQFWNLLTGEKQQQCSDNTVIKAMTLSSSGRYLATVADQEISKNGYIVSLWDVDNQEKLAEFFHTDQVNALTFSPNTEYLITASGSLWANMGFQFGGMKKDNAVRFWKLDQIDQKKEVFCVPHQSEVHALAFSLDGTYWASGCADGRIYLFSLNSPEPIVSMTHPSALVNIITAISFSPDGKLLATASEGGSVRLWNIPNGTEIYTINLGKQVDSVSFSSCGNYLVTATGNLSRSEDYMAQVWKVDIPLIQEIACISHYREPISAAIFSPDGRYVITTGGDHQARFWYWQPDDLISQANQRLIPNPL